MPKIPSITERELGSLSPRGLDKDFMSRLTACTDGSLLELSESELQFEKSLRDFKPHAVSGKLHSKLFAAIGDTPFSVDEKIVLFNRSNTTSAGKRKPSRFNVLRFNVAAAAAVALLGTITALMVPTDGGATGSSISDNTSEGSAVVSPVGSFAPASYNRNLSDTRDEGVIWRGNNIPHRVMRFTYMDRVTWENDQGETLEVEQPRDEFVIIPEKID